jgi:hypothetical protein
VGAHQQQRVTAAKKHVGQNAGRYRQQDVLGADSGVHGQQGEISHCQTAEKAHKPPAAPDAQPKNLRIAMFPKNVSKALLIQCVKPIAKARLAP